MTSHRITDLSYGHLGEASYDVEENSWDFSVNPLQKTVFQQVLPLSQIQPPSIRSLLELGKPSDIPHSQKKWLAKTIPESFPANVITGGLSRLPSIGQHRHPASSGQLLAIGGAIAVEHMSGYRMETIIAIPSGEVGEVLRLIRPRLERHGWGNKSSGSARISLLDGSSSEQGHWVGNGGNIQQITFSEDKDLASTWLAVRQASVTTIFRPLYHKRPVPAKVPAEFGVSFPPSRVDSNPVATLTAERSGSKRHADVSFNPYYPRQFAIVDESGYWSIWDIEGRLRKRSMLELVAGKRGNIYDSFKQHPLLKDPDSADGWHRVLWAGSVSTIAVCNRRHFALFDLRGAPTRLKSAEILAASNTDWILDIQRSTSNPSHLYVLTSSRIFWVEVTAAGEETDKNKSGSRVLLSYRHFRDPNDESLKLTLLQDENVSVLLSSSRCFLMNFYNFSFATDSITAIKASQGSFVLSVDETGSVSSGVETIQFLQAPLAASSSQSSGLESAYIKGNVRFYQAWAVTSNLSLRSTLTAVHAIVPGDSHNPMLTICAPTWKAPVSRRYLAKVSRNNPFVVPDGVGDEEVETSISGFGHLSLTDKGAQEDLRRRINWRELFQYVFPQGIVQSATQTSKPFDKMSDLLKVVSNYIVESKEDNSLPISSFLELSHSCGFSEDLEKAAPDLRGFLKTILVDDNPDHSSALHLANLSLCPETNIPTIDDFPELLEINNRLGEQWMASMPLHVSYINRLAKFKITRHIAAELCLSSIGVFLEKQQPVDDDVPGPDSTNPPINPPNKVRNQSRESSAGLFSSQLALVDDPSASLPTPNRTPSLYSQSSGVSGDYVNDHTTSVLCSYVGSINPRGDLVRSKMLSYWPITPVSDPPELDWEAIRNPPQNEESGEETDVKKRKEDARRRRRTEKFLSKARLGTVEEASQSMTQPAFTAFGSQPDVAHVAASSQIIDEPPMTQPVGGLFGSRSIQVTKKRQKKRRAAGF